MTISSTLILDRKISETSFVVFDTETSLVPSSNKSSPAHYDMVEIACAATIGKGRVESFESLVKPYYSFNAPSCRAKHITDKVLASAPRFPQIANKLIELFKQRIVVGQNTQFDIRVLRMATEKYANAGQISSAQVSELTHIVERPYFDTRKLFIKLYPDQQESSLDYMMSFFGITVSSRQKHLAGEDALLTLQVFQKITEKLQTEKGLETVGNLFDFQNGTFGVPNQLSLI